MLDVLCPTFGRRKPVRRTGNKQHQTIIVKGVNYKTHCVESQQRYNNISNNSLPDVKACRFKADPHLMRDLADCFDSGCHI